jgi:hypothetical protein
MWSQEKSGVGVMFFRWGSMNRQKLLNGQTDVTCDLAEKARRDVA